MAYNSIWTSYSKKTVSYNFQFRYKLNSYFPISHLSNRLKIYIKLSDKILYLSLELYTITFRVIQKLQMKTGFQNIIMNKILTLKHNIIKYLIVRPLCKFHSAMVQKANIIKNTERFVLTRH